MTTELAVGADCNLSGYGHFVLLYQHPDLFSRKASSRRPTHVSHSEDLLNKQTWEGIDTTVRAPK